MPMGKSRNPQRRAVHFGKRRPQSPDENAAPEVVAAPAPKPEPAAPKKPTIGDEIVAAVKKTTKKAKTPKK